MKIVGLCQFSVFGPPGRGDPADGRLEVASLEEALERLWHPVRMAQRFHLLEMLLLPSIRAQTGPWAEIVVATSAAMPEVFQARLARVTADIPGLRHIRMDGTAQDGALLSVMEAASSGFAEPVAYFQVGEDQALAMDFTARLRDAVGRVDPGGMVSFPTGVFGFHDGMMVRHCIVHEELGPIGLAGVMPAGPPEVTCDRWLSRDIGRVPVFTDPTFAAYHRTLLAGPAVPDYRHLFPVSGVVRRLMVKTIEQNQELTDGKMITRRAEVALAEGFAQTSAEALREVLTAALEPVALAEAMGFALEPQVG